VLIIGNLGNLKNIGNLGNIGNHFLNCQYCPELCARGKNWQKGFWAIWALLAITFKSQRLQLWQRPKSQL